MIVCFSQTTYPKILNDSLIVITPLQLKQTNLIFLEHNRLQLEKVQTDIQINAYNKLINNYEYSDSIKNNKISLLSNTVEEYNNTIINQNKQLSKLHNKNKIFTICGVAICASLGLLLFIK